MPLEDFSTFQSLRIVKDDTVEVENLMFLLSQISDVQKEDEEAIRRTYYYFHSKRYPWFLINPDELKVKERRMRIEKIYDNVRGAFSCKEDDLPQLG